MANFSDRISRFLREKGISIRGLEQMIGCSNGVISRCISKKTDISSQWVSKIIEIFPDLNPTWLLLGEGSMIISSERSEQNLQEPIIFENEAPPRDMWQYVHLKDREIGRLHEEVGKLKARIEQLERELNEAREFHPMEHKHSSRLVPATADTAP